MPALSQLISAESAYRVVCTQCTLCIVSLPFFTVATGHQTDSTQSAIYGDTNYATQHHQLDPTRNNAAARRSLCFGLRLVASREKM